MYYIDDYRQQAINKIIPYLIEFPEIVSIIEDSADRYQAIEDILWKIANNFKVINSRGVFLNAHAHNEVVELVYTDKAKDAFTYGTEYPKTQAFGTGHFYSQASYLSGISKDVSEDKLIRAVQEKIIQNNTNGTIQDFIEAMKLHFNATSVKIYESYPLAISLMESGKKLELSSSGNKEAIKKCLPACVSLNNLYINDHLFDQFMYSKKSSYANDSRYPITLGNTDYLYKYISTAVNLNSNDKEYIKINSPFYNVDFTQNEIPFECICGKLTDIKNNGVIYSFIYNSTDIYKVSLITKQIDNKNYFVLSRDMWNDTDSLWQNVDLINTNIEVIVNKDYTFLLNINRNSFDFCRVWIFNDVKLIGQTTFQDTSWIYNMLQNDTTFTEIQLNTTNINYDTQNILNAEIINYDNKNLGNYSDIIYYCILGGVLNDGSNIDIENESSHYYITCFGEKNLLFNCLSNKNHVIINTDSILQNNLTIKQSSFNYKKWHSNGRYLNIYNKNSQPSIRWNSQQPIDSLINSFELSFDLCLPINSTANILNGLLGSDTKFNISYNFDKQKLTIVLPTYTSGNVETPYTVEINLTNEEFIKKFNNLKIKYSDNKISIYIDDVLLKSENVLDVNVRYLNAILELGPINAFIKNLIFNCVYTDGINISNLEYNLPLIDSLYEKNNLIQPINYNARFLTVPQLIDNTANKDLFNNETLRIVNF